MPIFPIFSFGGNLAFDVAKGENGQQSPAGFYKNPKNRYLFALGNFNVIEGSPLGYVNLTDLNRLLITLAHVTEGYLLNFGFVPPIVLGVKHGNCCCGAVGRDWSKKEVNFAAREAANGDPESLWGGFIICNFQITEEIAEILSKTGVAKKQMFDGVIADGFDPGAIEFFKRKTGRCRCIVAPKTLKDIRFDKSPHFCHTVGGDMLVQENYQFVPDFGFDGPMVVTGDRCREQVWSLVLADAICRTSNSNTITITSNGVLRGNGVGQRSRVGAAKLCLATAENAKHIGQIEEEVSAAASDSFFPFSDGPQVLMDAGVKAIFSTLSPGGAERDKAIQQLCRENNVTLYQLPDNDARGFFGHG